MKTKLALALLALLSWFLLPEAAKADGIIVPDPPICEPGPCPPVPFPMAQLEIRYHHVEVTIADQIALTRVDQVFYNPNDWTVEGTYIFPIPADAAITDFTLWVDGEPVQGEVLSAEEARRAYEQIVRDLQDPALLEYADRGAVRARIFPIPPGGERRIQLEYSQALTAENGLVRYVYPLNTEKFSAQMLEEVTISVDLRTNQPIRAVYSPSHAIAVSRADDFHATAGYEASNVRPDTDFALYYSIGESEALHLLTYRDPADPSDPDGFFLLMLAPHPRAESQPQPKDLFIVLDRSGSMEGEKFLQAQQALKYILAHLNPQDRFNIITFSTDISMYARNLRPAEEGNEAAAWVDRQSAVGNTDINRALLEAAAMTQPGHPAYLIFLTDGLPTEGVLQSEQIITNFDQAAPENLRLFAFGVGYDVDTYLLDSLAQAHHGGSEYILPGQPLDEAVSAFYAKISTPVLTDLQLDFGEIPVYDIYPNPLPDLFAGSQIVVTGRYRGSGTTDITLAGLVNGQTQTFTFPDQIFITAAQEANNPLYAAIPRIWATRKIGYLLNQIRLQSPQQELIDQIVRLSIRYGIVTPYTSYLVTEPMVLGAEAQQQIANEAYQNLKSAPAAPTSGQEAVEQAAAEGEMRQSDTAQIPAAQAADRVRIAGSRTFVLSDGVWVDTAFDPETMQTMPVAFLSDDYFSLLKIYPDLGASFALGPRVIAISGGTAYEVMAADSPLPALDLPNPEDLPAPAGTGTDSTSESVPGTVHTPKASSESPFSGRGFPCLAGMLPLALFIILRRFFPGSN